VLAAIAIGPFLSFMQKFRGHLDKLEKLMGVVLIVTGILFLTGSINWFGSWLLDTFPALSEIEAWVTPEGLGRDIMERGTRQ
jgi:cytochrome c-type biogenesis protein